MGAMGTAHAQAQVIVIQAPIYPQAPQGTEPTVKVTRITFSGHTVFSTAWLEAVVASAIGKVLTLRGLSDVAGLVSAYYASLSLIHI